MSIEARITMINAKIGELKQSLHDYEGDDSQSAESQQELIEIKIAAYEKNINDMIDFLNKKKTKPLKMRGEK